MTFAGGAVRAARLLVAAAIAGLACLAPAGASVEAEPVPTGVQPAGAPTEVRALWVLRTSLTTPDRIAALAQAARDHGFNTLLVQVRGRGDAYYRGGIEPIGPELVRQSATFDPLAAVLSSARAAGLSVHAWVNVNLVSSAAELPTARDHVVWRRPGWLMIPRDIAQELSRIDPDSPGYVGKLARWTRSRPEEIEGLYATPILPDSAAHTEAVVRDLVRRYAVDGVHFDYARYPNERFDYSRGAIAAFRAHVRPRLDAATRGELDARQADDALAYPDALEAEWQAFRVERMNALMERLGAAVRQTRPGTLVTAATVPDPREAVERRLQDWRTWLQAGAIDAVCPMAYAPEAARFAEQIATAREAAGDRAVWAGIGAYRIPAAQTIENIRTARRLGAAGIVLFSYDSLIDPRQSAPDYLAAVGRGAFADRAANAGSR
jgi:uncharacterized lipoprotein YddW (UPF0748 family)